MTVFLCESSILLFPLKGPNWIDLRLLLSLSTFLRIRGSFRGHNVHVRLDGEAGICLPGDTGKHWSLGE